MKPAERVYFIKVVIQSDDWKYEHALVKFESKMSK